MVMRSQHQIKEILSAPRFHAYFERLEGRSVLLMHRREWEKLIGYQGEFVEIDLSQTPIAALMKKNGLEASVAKRSSESEIVLEIYRNDPKDVPTPINVDRYTIWERLPCHHNYMDMVNSASTEDNSNMRGFLDEYVFFVKEPMSDDHWLPELPTHIQAAVRGQGRHSTE